MNGTRLAALVGIVICAGLTAACGRYATGSASTSQAAAPNYGTPPGRVGAAMAYDPQVHEVLMFGGGTPSSGLNDTWAWDGKGWTQLHPTDVPAASNGSMVYDSATRELLLSTSDQTGSKIWAWKNNDWVQLRAFVARTCTKLAGGGVACSPPLASGPEGFGSAVYDAALGKIVMQGGVDTWAGDGVTWTKIASLDSSLANCFCLGYDSATRQVLTLAYTGGKFSPAVGHTLLLQGAAWTMTPAKSPVVTQALLVDDPRSSALVMLSVNENYGNALPEEMWSWNGSSWKQLQIGLPPLLSGSSVAYDAARKQVVLFGGLDAYGAGSTDTWIWDGRSWQKRPGS